MPEGKLAIYCDNGFIETFTKAHLEQLKPAYVFSGSPFPKTINGNPLQKDTLFSAIQRRIAGKGIDPLDAFRASLLHARPSVFIAEYGVSAAPIIDIVQDLNITLIVNFYGYDAFNRDVVSKHAVAYKKVFDYAAFVCAQSNSIKRELIAMGCKPEKIVINPVPPNDAFFQLACNPNSNTLISVGRFVNKKAPFAVLLAFQRVLAQVPSAKLIMIGDGPLFFACKEMAGMLGIAESIEFTGRLNPDQQRECMQRASIFVQHSVVGPDGDSEGLPVAIMEASAMGMPIVSTIHSGIPEAVEDGVTGLLSPEFDAETMAANIIRLLANPTEGIEMGRKGKEKMQASFRMEMHIENLKQLVAKTSR
jgi:colanic acid/amylovoran biosynthesis glycosyltransferase